MKKILVVIVLSLICSQVSYAGSDSLEYSRPTLAEDFIKIAFSEHDWKDVSPYGVLREKDYIEQIKIKAPWSIESNFIERPLNHRAPVNRLNRWPEGANIGVSIGFPFDDARGDANFSAIVQERILSLSPKIQERAVVSFKFMEDSASIEKARIRILPIDSSLQSGPAFSYGFLSYNRFKLEREVGYITHSPFHPSWFQSYIVDAVRYTPMSRSQVDGYFLPNKDNVIELAVCPIWGGHSDSVLRQMISECLMRSLGLPGMSEQKDDVILGNWGKPFHAYSARNVLDGEAVYRSREYKEMQAWQSQDLVNQSDVLPEYKNVEKDWAGVTEYDFLMLDILYCKKLNAGMTREDVVKIVVEQGDCL